MLFEYRLIPPVSWTETVSCTTSAERRLFWFIESGADKERKNFLDAVGSAGRVARAAATNGHRTIETTRAPGQAS